MEKIISKQSVPEWVKKLDDYTIFAPVKREDHWSFEVIENPDVIDLGYLNTTPSPKKAVFPPREVFFEFSGAENGNEPDQMEIKETFPEEKPQIVFGIRPCDAKAINLIDQVFAGDFNDPYYLKRREMTILVGLGCAVPPSDNCFCTSVGGSPHGKTGLDILVTDLGDDYYVESLTPRGVQVMDFPGNFFRVPKNEERSMVRKIHESAKGKIKRKINDVEKITERLGEPNMFTSPLWEEEAKACIRCGICTFLCPSCHCFDMNDEVERISPLKGKRVRTWDNCQFPDFTMHSSGHNPRPDKAARLRRRVLHKYPYFFQTNGDYLCTGCGRCITNCPVGIDIIEILNRAERLSDNE
jgi:sulfhydrogenase subunit beta (sulfur reductase)